MPTTATTLRITRFLNAPRALVFKAWTDVEMMRRWLAPEYCTLLAAEAEVRVGGSFRVAMDWEGKGIAMYGTYREITPPTRLVFTHQWEEEDAVETLVTIDLAEQDGGTLLTLSQTGFTRATAATGHEEGWNSALDALEKVLG